MNINLNKWVSVICATLFVLIIAFHEFLYVKLILWVLLGLLCLYEPRCAVDAVFFFAAFFVGAGFFQNPLVTIKHFHIALVILTLASFVHGKSNRWSVKENWRPNLILISWIALIMISTFSLWWSGEGVTKGLRTNGNLLLTLVCGGFLSFLMRPEEAMRGLGFLAFGTSIRAILGILTSFGPPGPYIQEVILYNNHLGFYCIISLFCLLPFIMTAKDRLVQIFSIANFYFLFFSLLLTCSRTGYISFVGGLISFIILQRWLKKRTLLEISRNQFGYCCCLFALAALCLY